MSRRWEIRWCAAFAVVALLAAAAAAQPGDEKTTPEPGARRALDAKVFALLKTVVNRGAELYNRDDFAGCYRVYEGSLMTLRPLLDHRPDLQKAITRGLAAAERDPQNFRRAFTLRTVFDTLLKELNPRKKSKPATTVAASKKKPEKRKPEGTASLKEKAKETASLKTKEKEKAKETASLKEKEKEKEKATEEPLELLPKPKLQSEQKQNDKKKEKEEKED